jgi:hypothetical protein
MCSRRAPVGVNVRCHVSARMPYCVAHRRELSPEERSLLRFLLAREAPDRLPQLEHLKVVARCGCGKCPTVLFGTSLDSEPVTRSHDEQQVASYRGANAEGVDVAVSLVAPHGHLAELEAWAPVGGAINSWPPANNLERFNWR